MKLTSTLYSAGALLICGACVFAPMTAAPPPNVRIIQECPKATIGPPVAIVNAKPAIAALDQKDWPQWGGNNSRNMTSSTRKLSIEFAPKLEEQAEKNLLYKIKLGSQTYGNATVGGGYILVGTNNGAHYREGQKGDKGVLLCFEEKTGKLKWQLTRDKLPQGRVSDWPEQGICSTPCIVGDKVYVITNRAELMCLDLDGFHDGKNDGMTKETLKDKIDADIIWSLDMIEDMGVFPHNLATSSPCVHDGLVFAVTSNGVDEAHLRMPAARSPNFIAVDAKTGKLVWSDRDRGRKLGLKKGDFGYDVKERSPDKGVLHGQWGSPAVGIVNGKAQVYMPGGDGWLYAFETKTGKLIWKFDLNPKDSKWELYGKGSRNAIISTPVFYENSVILAVGQDPEHGEGVGHLFRIDATKKGDISPTISAGNGKWKKNANSGVIWHHGGYDKEGEYIYRRTISTAAVANGLVYAADLSGFLHCLDLKTGKRYWEYDTFTAIWGSPMVVDGKVLLGDEEGNLHILAAGKKMKRLKKTEFPSSVYTTPTICNGRIYITDRSQLFVFKAR